MHSEHLFALHHYEAAMMSMHLFRADDDDELAVHEVAYWSHLSTLHCHYWAELSFGILERDAELFVRGSWEWCCTTLPQLNEFRVPTGNKSSNWWAPFAHRCQLSTIQHRMPCGHSRARIVTSPPPHNNFHKNINIPPKQPREGKIRKKKKIYGCRKQKETFQEFFSIFSSSDWI